MAQDAQGSTKRAEAQAMGWRNGSRSCGRGMRLIHWTTALLVFARVGLGFVAGNLPHGPLRAALFDLHRSLEALILPPAAFRLVWRVLDPSPPLKCLGRLEHAAAAGVHAGLYVLPVRSP